MKFSDNYEIYRGYVFDKKYRTGDESIQDMYDRVTTSIIRKAVELYGELDSNVIKLKEKLPEFMGTKWIPGGSILSNLGVETKSLNSLANCTVYFNKDDSYSGISQNEEAIRNLCKRRCGAGQDISHYRPEGATILNAAITSTGLTTRMESFSNVLLEVAQNGRRGALMLTCHINHPDILKFMTYKSLDVNNCNGANVSVLFTDEFYNSLKSKDKNEKWIMKFPIDTELTKEEMDKLLSSGINTLVEFEGGRSAKWNLVSEIWSTHVKCNIKGAEPGAINIDTVRKSASNLYEEGYIESTNPCGEIPLPIGDSCRLSSVILSAYPDFMEKDYYEDFLVIGFASDILIDLDIDYSKAILDKVRSQNKNRVLDKEVEMWELFISNAIKMRRNGLGFTGLADFFAANQVIYGSTESVDLAKRMAAKFSGYVSEVSVHLAKSYGPFTIWDYDKEKGNQYIKDNFLPIKDYKTYGRRWIASLTVAPNGSLSIITGTTSGAEPLFAKRYNRMSLGKSFEITHPFLTPKNEKYYIEAKEVDALAKVAVLSQIQKYWDNSISVTYNLPKGVSESLVSNLYLKSHDLGAKGMTIYVDGSRENVYSDIKPETFERPEFIECDVHHLNFMGERWVAFIGKLEGKLWEVFLGIEDEDRYLPKSITKGHLRKVNTGTGNSRYDFRFKDKYGYYCYVGGVNHIFKSDLWNYGRLISALMRTNTPAQLYQIVSKLYNESESINSWKSNLLRVIKSYINEGEVLSSKCSECGGALVKREGCITCSSCGIQSCN